MPRYNSQIAGVIDKNAWYYRVTSDYMPHAHCAAEPAFVAQNVFVIKIPTGVESGPEKSSAVLFCFSSDAREWVG